ncbi:NAD(P)H-hydrate epimerase [Adlercreutzia sp. ZJ473]|uniref:NAD(P)H-hydrate epimerase n=1 Tax=Adlercreutzia sp. ZJ473 TaxID=2722822 RepID=UPI0020A6B2D8|nr:NAD(P)H-hydrate epimerase [Adlercreutzia sp. ZJ473]
MIAWDDAAGLPVLDVGQVVELERRIAAEGASLYELMKRAGAAVAEAVCAEVEAIGAVRTKAAAELEVAAYDEAVAGLEAAALDEIAAMQPSVALDEATAESEAVALDEAASGPSSVVVLAGSGNNGGDGWVAASLLAGRGMDVTLVTKTPADQVQAEPAHAAAHDACTGADAPRFAVAVNPDTAQLDALLSQADVVVDAILGTGFSHLEVREPYATWINAVNCIRCDMGARVIAVDVPSGLNAQTGEPADSCVQADITVTMLAAKPGLLTARGRAQAGRLFLASLGCDV